MNAASSRGSAAVIAMIIVALTGLTVMSYATSSTSATAADASSVAGWRSLYATDAGIAATVSKVAAGATTSSMPPIAGVPTVTISGTRSLGFVFDALFAQSQRHASAWVIVGSLGRPVVSSWEMYTGALVTTPPTDYANGNLGPVGDPGTNPDPVNAGGNNGNGNGNGNNGNGNGNGGGNGNGNNGNGNGNGGGNGSNGGGNGNGNNGNGNGNGGGNGSNAGGNGNGNGKIK